MINSYCSTVMCSWPVYQIQRSRQDSANVTFVKHTEKSTKTVNSNAKLVVTTVYRCRHTAKEEVCDVL